MKSSIIHVTNNIRRPTAILATSLVRCQNNNCSGIKRNKKTGKIVRVKIYVKPWFSEKQRKYCNYCIDTIEDL